MEDEKGWIAAEIQCDLCSYKWVGVYWHECEKLECPNCSNMSTFEVLKYT